VEEKGGKVVWGIVVGMLVAWPICKWDYYSYSYSERGGEEWGARCLVEEAESDGVGAETSGPLLTIHSIVFPNQYLHMMALRRKMMRGKKKA